MFNYTYCGTFQLCQVIKVLKYIFVVIQPSHFYVRRDCSLFSVNVKATAVNRIFVMREKDNYL